MQVSCLINIVYDPAGTPEKMMVLDANIVNGNPLNLRIQLIEKTDTQTVTQFTVVKIT
jgi:hypothetical protein